MTIQQHASFDSSAAELNATSKLVKAWETKNAKNTAKAGGVSLMALSLAACGGSSDTAAVVVTPATETPATETPATETPVVEVTPVAQALTVGTAGETITGTTAADAITAINTASATTTGLDVTDVITDATAGDADTFTLVMGAAFAGFTDSVGSMSGIESISLSNDSAVARTFDASNITGVTTYNVDATTGSIAINDAQTVTTLNLSNQASGTMTMTMDVTGDNAATTVATTVAGTADSLAFNVTAVGTANSAAATVASNASAVSLATSGYETIAVTSSGSAANLVNLSTAVGAATITASGTALTISDVAAATTAIDGSAMTGALTLTTATAGASALTSIKGGAGADTFNIVAADLSSTATIDGGASDDTLSLSGTGITFAPTLTLVEALDVTQVLGTSTISLLNSATAAAGLEIVLDNPRNAVETFTGTLTLANDTGATEFGITGAHAGALTTTTTGAVTVDLDPAGGAAAAQVVSSTIDANSAASLSVDAARFSSFTGTISADAAETVTATATRVAFGGDIDADAATGLTLDSNGAAMTLNTNASTGFLGATTVVASGATTAGTGGSMNVGAIGATTLTTSASTITVSELAGGFTAGVVDSGAGSLTLNTVLSEGTTTTTSLNSGGALTVTNTGSLGTLATGAVTSSDGAITINSANAIGNVTVGAISGDNAVTVNLAGMVGTYAQGNVTDAGTFTLNAATYGGTAITGDTYTVETAATLNLAQAGTHIVQHAADEDILTVTLATGAGTDNVTVNHGAVTDTLTVTGSLGTAVATDVLTVGTNTIFSTVNTAGVTGADGGVAFDMAAVGASYTGGAGVDTVTDAGAITVASTISTGAGNDIITLNAANTAAIGITGGAGLDTINLTGATGIQNLTFATGDTGLTVATADSVTAFLLGTDTLSLGFALNNSTFVIDTSGVAGDVTTNLAIANNAMDGTVRAVLVDDTALSHLYIDFNADGNADGAVTFAASANSGAFGDLGTTAALAAGATFATDAGAADVIVGGSGADIIVGTAGGDTITGGLGIDTITLGAAGGVDTIVMTTGGAVDVDTVAGFIVAGGEDELQVDLSDLNGITGTMQQADATVLAAVATGVGVVTNLALAGGTDFGAAASDMITLTSATALTAATLETAIEGNNLAPGLTAGDSILIAYDNNVSSFVALLTDNAGTADGAAFTDVTITNILQFTDVADAATILTTSFAIV